jgi:hypothetical protein
MTPDERALLMSRAEDGRSDLKDELSLAFSPWISMLIVYVFAWAILSWLARVLLGWELGWDSQWAAGILSSGVLLCTFFMGIHVTKSLKSRRRSLNNVQADLSTGVVEEADLRFTQAKRFQEPEHGGLMYFLHTSSNQVFVLFDHESQDIGVDGEDPLSSSFQPQVELKLVRAPASRIILGRTFSGGELALASPLELAAPPKDWPESGAYCGTPWEELEARFAA